MRLELGGILIDLHAQRRFRVEQLRELVVSTAEALANADEARLQVTDLLAVAAQSALADIDGALERLETDTYGACSGCDQAVAVRRLQMLPTAQLCIRCHYLSERGPTRRGLGHAVGTPTTATPSRSAGRS